MHKRRAQVPWLKGEYNMWWSEDEYTEDVVIPDAFIGRTGPKGIAIVREHPNGKTDPGWGMRSKPGFMENYERNLFAPTTWVNGYRGGAWSLAYVMRSLQMVCIDIDGKNGGLEHVGRLGMLPYTLAETSRSGNGYHLFYATSEDTWSSEFGFAGYRDRIGIQQGVDLRATGCVFHHRSQRWNNRELAELPQHLKDLLQQGYQKADAMVATIANTLATEDPDQIVVMQDALVDDLGKPIPLGRRNNTLFAVGTQMMLAKVPDWEDRVHARAVAVGLDRMEASKLVMNIEKYGATA